MGYGNRRVQNWRAERKLKPWQDAAKAEQAAVKANADFYYRKAVAENPQLASNPVSRLWQKRKLQKQYAAACRAAEARRLPKPGKQRRPRQRRPRKPPRSPSAPPFFVKAALEEVALIVGGIGPSAGDAAGLPAILFLHVRRRGVQYHGIFLSLLRIADMLAAERSLLRQRG
ncbi:MAG: hypothetical protein ACLTNN_08490 [Blautia sp.]